MFKLQNIVILRKFKNEGRIIRIFVIHGLMYDIKDSITIIVIIYIMYCSRNIDAAM